MKTIEDLQPSGPELFVTRQLTKAFLVPHGGNKVRVVKKERLYLLSIVGLRLA